MPQWSHNRTPKIPKVAGRLWKEGTGTSHYFGTDKKSSEGYGQIDNE